MTSPTPNTANQVGPFLLRSAAYFLFWVVLAGTGVKDIAAGFVTALLASWLSLQLVPPGELAVKPGRAFALFIRFLWQSVVAGVTVARIALSPVMALRPGMVDYHTRLAPGNRRYAFMTFASLLPGTLPLRSSEGQSIAVHALDTGQDVEGQLAEEEARLTALFVEKSAP